MSIYVHSLTPNAASKSRLAHLETEGVAPRKLSLPSSPYPILPYALNPLSIMLTVYK